MRTTKELEQVIRMLERHEALLTQTPPVHPHENLVLYGITMAKWALQWALEHDADFTKLIRDLRKTENRHPHATEHWEQMADKTVRNHD